MSLSMCHEKSTDSITHMSNTPWAHDLIKAHVSDEDVGSLHAAALTK